MEYYLRSCSMNWVSSARWGDVMAVDADLDRLGTSSVTVRFTVRVGERTCCTVTTTYVATTEGRSVPWPEDVRAAVTGA